MQRAAFVGGEFEPLFFQLHHLLREQRTCGGQFAVDFPAARERSRGLHDLGDLERLGDVEDLVGGARRLADLDRREIGIAGDDDEVDLGIERADAARGLAPVDARRHANVDEGDRIGRTGGERGLDRGDRIQSLVTMRQREVRGIVVRRAADRIVAEQLGGHRVERAVVAAARGREAARVAVMHRRFVVDDQKPLRLGGQGLGGHQNIPLDQDDEGVSGCG